MRNLFLFLGFLAFSMPLFSTPEASVFETFTITTGNVEVKNSTPSSLELTTNHDTYFIKLEPNRDGRVVFALSGIGYTSTAKVPGLRFGVRISGYCGDDNVTPTYSFDDNNREMEFFGDTLVFRRITGSLPVWFDQQVDSIKLEIFNSMSLDVDQYMTIHDLGIVPYLNVIPNPAIPASEDHTVMIGIDGSSSIKKPERAAIGRQLIDLVKSSQVERDTNALCIMEFGTSIHALIESTDERELKSAIRYYKRDKHNKSDNTRFTNWSVALDEAIRRRPGVFVFITDGWSNWSDGRPTSFSAQFDELVAKCNTLKSNGTHVLFITSGMDLHDTSNAGLYPFLDGHQTREVRAALLNSFGSLRDIDLVTMKEFSDMEMVDLTSIVPVPQGVAAGD